MKIECFQVREPDSIGNNNNYNNNIGWKRSDLNFLPPRWMGQGRDFAARFELAPYDTLLVSTWGTFWKNLTDGQNIWIFF